MAEPGVIGSAPSEFICERRVIGESVRVDERAAEHHEVQEALLHAVGQLVEIGDVLQRRGNGAEVLLRESGPVDGAPDRVGRVPGLTGRAG